MRAPVETKVKSAGWAALVAAFVVGVAVQKVPALAGLSEVMQSTVVAVLTAAAASAAGWLARHTPR